MRNRWSIALPILALLPVISLLAVLTGCIAEALGGAEVASLGAPAAEGVAADAVVTEGIGLRVAAGAGEGAATHALSGQRLLLLYSIESHRLVDQVAAAAREQQLLHSSNIRDSYVTFLSFALCHQTVCAISKRPSPTPTDQKPSSSTAPTSPAAAPSRDR
jgi:hypothetical protein